MGAGLCLAGDSALFVSLRGAVRGNSVYIYIRILGGRFGLQPFWSS